MLSGKDFGIPHDFEPINKPCPRCGKKAYQFKWCEANNSIQQRCHACGTWIGNAKYDFRTKEEIIAEVLEKWRAKHEESGT